MSMERRTLLRSAFGLPVMAGAGGIVASMSATSAQANETDMSRLQFPDSMPIDALRPGDYIWAPEMQPTGPVSIVISIPEQLVHVYRNGVRIAVSTCSTGKPGHETPTGTFVILQKHKDHYSSIYNNAPMPNMQRLTWGGIALHAGNLPGYPASHGCVRLPREFSEKLFTVTHLGTPVIVSGAHSDPYEITHPGMILTGYADDRMAESVAELAENKQPEDWAERDNTEVTTLVISSHNYEATLLQNNHVVGSGNYRYGGSGNFGSQVLVLKYMDVSKNQFDWSTIAFSDEYTDDVRPMNEILNSIEADETILAELYSKMHPGMILILTDAPLDPDQTAEDFTIMS